MRKAGMMIALCFALVGVFLAGPWPVQECHAATEVGSEAPDFILKDVNDNTVRLSDQRGKVVMLSFWRQYCRPCVAEMDLLIKLHNDYYKKGFEILSITWDDKKDVMEFLKTKPLPYVVLLDPEGKTIKPYNIFAIPKVFVVDKKGIIRHLTLGYSPDPEGRAKTEKEYRELIEKLLAE